jgi:hypothetical protein
LAFQTTGVGVVLDAVLDSFLEGYFHTTATTGIHIVGLFAYDALSIGSLRVTQIKLV